MNQPPTRRWQRAGLRVALAPLLVLPHVARAEATGQAAPTGIYLAEDGHRVYDVARDETDRIWAIVHRGRFEVCYWDDTADRPGWRSPRKDLDVQRAFAKRLIKGADGSVVCLWQFSGNRVWAVSRHCGNSVRLIARFGTEHKVSRSYDDVPGVVFVDSKGNVWVGLVDMGLLRISPEGKKELVYAFKKDQFRVFGGRADLAVLGGFEDLRGRIWFWGPGHFVRYDSLRGVLIVDGDSFEYHRVLKGVPDEQYSTFVPKDKRTFWLGMVKRGLYELNAETLEARQVPAPVRGAFGFVEDVFTVGADRYVVAGPAKGRPGKGTLWRLRDGSWERVIERVNLLEHRPMWRRRAWVTTESGLWVGGNKEGLWFVPRTSGAPVRVDWRRGLPLASVDWLVRLDRDRLLAAERRGLAVVAEADALLAPRKVASGFSLLETRQPLVQTRDGRIWGLLANKRDALCVWDGRSWRAHPIPKRARAHWPDPPRHDTRNRIWTIPYADQGHTGIYDPASDSWETYATYAKALEAQIGHHEGFAFEDVALKSPQFSRDGRICYTRGPRTEYPWKPSPPGTVRYFNGTTWRDIKIRQIDPSIRPGRPAADGPCFFTGKGQLAVNIQGRTWALVGDERWQQVGLELGLGTVVDYRRAHQIKTPRGCVTGRPDSITVDRTGVYWLTWRRRLYKAIDGLCMPAFAPGEQHPFIDGRKLLRALVDARGNTFLYTRPKGWKEYVMIRTEATVPDTKLAVARTGHETFKLVFSAARSGEWWYRWRLDGGAWSRPTKETIVHLDPPSEGKHVIEAVAIDTNLHVDPTPARAPVEVRTTPEMIARWIEALSSPDYDVREAAVKALVSRPDRALPVLKQARPTDDDDRRWWIDTAIQLIEAKRNKAR